MGVRPVEEGLCPALVFFMPSRDMPFSAIISPYVLDPVNLMNVHDLCVDGDEPAERAKRWRIRPLLIYGNSTSKFMSDIET